MANNILHDLILTRDTLAIDQLLMSSGSVHLIDEQDNDGNTPLHLAAKQGDDIIVKLLLNHKANPNIQNNNKKIPQDLALKYVLAHEADAYGQYIKYQQAIKEKNSNHEPLFLNLEPLLSNNPGLCCIVLFEQQKRKLLNESSKLVETAFKSLQEEFEAPAGFIKPVNILIQHPTLNNKFSLTIQKKIPTTPNCIVIQDAVFANNITRLRILLRKFPEDINTISNKILFTPLYLAAKRGFADCLEELLSYKAELMLEYDGSTALHVAARSGHINCLKVFLKHKININAPDRHNFSPIYYAIRNGREDCVKFLIQNKADINLAAINNYTPLYLAAEIGHASIIKLLLAHGAAIQGSDIGNNPLHVAAINGHLECIKVLMAHGVSYAENFASKTPLQLAQENNHTRCAELITHLLSQTKPPNIVKEVKKSEEKLNIHENIEKLADNANKKIGSSKKAEIKPLSTATNAIITNTIENITKVEDKHVFSSKKRRPAKHSKNKARSSVIKFLNTYNILQEINSTKKEASIIETNDTALPNIFIIEDWSKFSLKENEFHPVLWGIFNNIHDLGFPVLLTGGAVRDMLYKHFHAKDIAPKDYDIVTTMPLAELKDYYARVRPQIKCEILGKEGGQTLNLQIDDVKVDIAFLGREKTEADLINLLETDAKKRDLTINNIYLEPSARQIIYRKKSIRDLKTGVLRLIGNPVERLRQEPYLIFRIIGFAIEYNFKMSSSLESALNHTINQLQTSQYFSYSQFYKGIEKLFISSIAGAGSKIEGITKALSWLSEKNYLHNFALHEDKQRCLYGGLKTAIASYDIYTAASEGNLEQLQDYFAKHHSFNLLDKSGATPFQYAIEHGQVEAVSYLLFAGATYQPTVQLNYMSAPEKSFIC